jgi:hypothetical protein
MTLSIIFSAASLILCGFFFLYFRAYLKRRISPEGLLEDYRDEVNKLIADIDAATDRDAYLVEERIKSLKSLMEEVDKKIGVYIQEFDRRRNNEAVYAALGRKTAGAALPPRPEEPAAVPPETPPGAGAPSPAVSGQALPQDAAPKPGALREQIAELAAQGLSPAVISARLKVSISEAELVIAIQNKANLRLDV